jgi:predicted metal-dependent phosphoesterase TrpH
VIFDKIFKASYATDNTMYKHNIISDEYGKELMKEGYFALDPHCHSSYSFDVPDVKETDPESIVKLQQSKRLMPIITDHDTLNGYVYLKNKGYKVIPAMELTFKPRIAKKITFDKPLNTMHINIFGLKNYDMLMLKDISLGGNLDELIRYLKQNDLDWMYNHPFYHEKKEKLNWKAIPGLSKEYFDVIELNSFYSKSLNNINQRIAEKLHKGIVASSDSHTGNPGQGYVIAEGKNFKDFWENVKNGNSYTVRREIGTWGIVQEASLMINQSFNANMRARKERKYTPATGVESFDSIAKSFTSGKLKNLFITKKIIQMTLQSMKYTAGPILAWRLHVARDEERAQRIKNRIHALTNKIRDIKENVKNKLNNNKLNTKSIHVQTRKIKRYKNYRSNITKKISNRS